VRRLKLQMQITVDGFVAGPNGELDWMTWEHSDKLIAFINQLIDTSDTILMGRKMSGGFVKYWEGVPQNSPEYEFARKMVRTPKIVFSRSVDHVDGKNVRVENRPLADAVSEMKKESGSDLLVYGGATFVASLIDSGLIDQLHLFVNPIAIGSGMRIFGSRTALKLASSTAYPEGIVVNTYEKR
jgi:dihydrofolate reductase